MVAAINQVGHTTGVRTIAEYVHTREIVEELEKLGVDFAQGYALGAPAADRGARCRLRRGRERQGDALMLATVLERRGRRRQEQLKEERTVDVHVRHLREKLEDDPARPEIIVTVRGVGYRCGLTGHTGDAQVAVAAA